MGNSSLEFSPEDLPSASEADSGAHNSNFQPPRENPSLSLVPPVSQRPRLFGANAPADPPAHLPARPAAPDIRDSHRSPEARAARASVDALIKGARRTGISRQNISRATVPAHLILTHLGDWLADSDAERQSPHTLAAKKISIEKLDWFLTRENCDQCGTAEVEAFMSHIREGHEEPEGRYGARTQQSYRPVSARAEQFHFVNIRTYFKWMKEVQLIPASPLEGVTPPAWKRPPIKPLTPEEVVALLDQVVGGQHPERDAAIIILMFDTGLRRAEVCSIRVSMIDLVRREILIKGKGDKTRVVPFSPDAARILRTYLTAHRRETYDALFYSERGSMFSDGLTGNGIRQMMKRLATRAGIDPKRVSPHKLRHGFATAWIQQNGSPRALQMVMGHSDLKTTFNYVTLVDSDAKLQQQTLSPARLLRDVKPK